MSPLTIRLRENGPYVVEGKCTLIDHEGKEFTLPTEKPALALCRCGQSKNRPFCDGTHRSVGFEASETAR
jgi:CDGSH-type Zn-finger protein